MLSFSDYKFELFYKIKEVNQLSKNITKDGNNIFIIEKTIDAKNIFSKTNDELFELAKKLDILMAPFLDQIIEKECEIRKLALLRDTLLPKLMSGELKINDINN